VDRRPFIAGTLGLLAVPRAARAQRSGQVPRIGYIGNGSPTTPASPQLEAFRQGLRELGYIEGQTVTIEYRWAEGKADQLPALADELVRAKVDVMVVAGGLGLRAGQRATSTIPIVFVILNDPVAVGLVKSFAHPGGNATGLASQFEELITKQLQLLKEAIPSISRIALLHHQLSVSTIVLDAAEAAARRLGLTARTLKVAEPIEFENAFKTARSERAGAVHVLPSPFFDAHRHQLIELAARYRLPAMYSWPRLSRSHPHLHQQIELACATLTDM
jgi:putative ABC transport system substrate-binding protein